LFLKKRLPRSLNPDVLQLSLQFLAFLFMLQLYEYKNKYENPPPQVMMQPVYPCSEYEAKNVTEGRGKYRSAVSKGIVWLAKNLLTSKISCMAPSPHPTHPPPHVSTVGQCLNSFSQLLA
jgi:hypothetical protein